MSFEVEGKLHKIFDTEQKTDSFRAREFVIQIEQGNYPQFVKFQLVQDRCELIDQFSETAQIKVYFDLRGREWNEKYFTNLSAWRIEPVGAAEESAPMDPFGEDAPGVGTSSAPAENSGGDETRAEDFDDLPF